jgi:hypothetical protein
MATVRYRTNDHRPRCGPPRTWPYGVGLVPRRGGAAADLEMRCEGMVRPLARAYPVSRVAPAQRSDRLPLTVTFIGIAMNIIIWLIVGGVIGCWQAR